MCQLVFIYAKKVYMFGFFQCSMDGRCLDSVWVAFIWAVFNSGLFWPVLKYADSFSSSREQTVWTKVSTSDSSAPYLLVGAHVSTCARSMAVIVYAKTITFQTAPCLGTWEKREGRIKWDGHSSLWTKAPLHALLVLLWEGRQETSSERMEEFSFRWHRKVSVQFSSKCHCTWDPETQIFGVTTFRPLIWYIVLIQHKFIKSKFLDSLRIC